MASEFEKYLKQKLKQIQLDENVFGEYIRGILDDQVSDDEKSEALEDVLAGVLESNIKEFITEILNKWTECHRKAVEEKPAEKPPEIDVEDRLVKLLETQKLATKQDKQYTEEEKKIRDQILSQYSQTAVEEDDEPLNSDDGSSGLYKNTNAADVQAQIREKREAAKLESQMKKQKDKEDREKQKKDREEKKEKRKTVKGERKR